MDDTQPIPFIAARDSSWIGRNGEKWESAYKDETHKSWVSKLRNSFTVNQLEEWFWTAYDYTRWDQQRARRKSAWFVQSGCTCNYN